MVVQWSNQTSFPDGLPSVPVFDRTLPVKQIHVLEALDILVLRADKGAALRWWLWEEHEGGCPLQQTSGSLLLFLLPVQWSFGGQRVGVAEGRRVSFSHDYVE